MESISGESSLLRSPRCLALAAGLVVLVALTSGCAEVPPVATSLPPGEVFRDCTVCPEMVVVPPGTFMMGSPDTAYDRTTIGSRNRLGFEKPVHRVTIDRPFAVGKYKVERNEFKAFINETGYVVAGSCMYWTGIRNYITGKNWSNAYKSATPRDPVVCVSWYDAKAYIAWLSEKTGAAYRLLSESEWEYVARNTQLFQISDMTGVAGEWLEDCWHETYDGAPDDGSPWDMAGHCSLRAVRGAIWYYGEDYLSSSTRSRYTSDLRNTDIGFRVARRF